MPQGPSAGSKRSVQMDQYLSRAELFQLIRQSVVDRADSDTDDTAEEFMDDSDEEYQQALIDHNAVDVEIPPTNDPRHVNISILEEEESMEEMKESKNEQSAFSDSADSLEDSMEETGICGSCGGVYGPNADVFHRAGLTATAPCICHAEK